MCLFACLLACCAASTNWSVLAHVRLSVWVRSLQWIQNNAAAAPWKREHLPPLQVLHRNAAFSVAHTLLTN
jgi:hypothetical protein